MNTISLLGCGYLGFPLAIELIKKGYYVKGSTTTSTKLQQLKQAGIIPYLIHIENIIPSDFFEADILVLTLPYKKSFTDPTIYRNQLNIVCDNVKGSSIQHIVFTSSSTVYPKDSKSYSPSDNFTPANLRAKVLLECEEIVNKLDNISVVTIRLGGIYGAGRLIKESTKHRRLVSHHDALKHIENGINMVGNNDCINGFTNIVI